MPSMSDVAEQYMYSDAMASMSVKIRIASRFVLKELITITGPKMPVSRLNRAHVEKCVILWRTRKLAESTVNKYKDRLRHFSNYCYENRLNRDDVAKHLKGVRVTVDYAKRKPLTAEQAARVLKAAWMSGPRNHICVLLLLSTGLRENEVINLRWRDVDLDQGFIAARRSKMADTLVVPLTNQLRTALGTWEGLYTARSGPINPDWYVVPAHRAVPPFRRDPAWTPLNPDHIQHNLGALIKRLMVQAGVTDLKGRASHTMRRTSGNMLLAAGADIRDVMTLFGHRSEEQSNAYLDRDVAREKLAERMREWKI